MNKQWITEELNALSDGLDYLEDKIGDSTSRGDYNEAHALTSFKINACAVMARLEDVLRTIEDIEEWQHERVLYMAQGHEHAASMCQQNVFNALGHLDTVLTKEELDKLWA